MRTTAQKLPQLQIQPALKSAQPERKDQAQRPTSLPEPTFGHDFSDMSISHPGSDVRSLPIAKPSGMIELPMQGLIHPLAASLAKPGIRFRLPEFQKVKAAYTDPDLKIPEAVIQARVTQLLERMGKEGRLKSKDSIATIVSKIFPAPGKMDEAEFNNAIEVTERDKIYKDVFEANTTVKSGDKPGLQTAMSDAVDLIKKVEADSSGLKEVFGAKDADAKKNYGKARKKLGEVSKHISTDVSTDYNLDDPEVGLGGWADFGARHMHLLASVVKGVNPQEAKATLIHESAHLADSSIDDHGYYKTPGFEGMEEDEKINNAAHYEELPRREMGVSSFVGHTFKPGESKGGGKLTRAEKIQREASEYMRKAWDAAVDTHTFIRGVRIQYLSGNPAPFTDHKKLILNISKLMDLTIHEQAAAKAVVTTLDLTLTESIARGVRLVGKISKNMPFPSPVGTLTDLELRDKIIDASVKDYGNLLKDAGRDKALLDWLVSKYRSLPSV